MPPPSAVTTVAVGGPFSAGGAKTPRHLSPDRLILAGGCFLYDLKLGDLDASFRELGGDFQFSAHPLNFLSQSNGALHTVLNGYYLQ